MANFLDLSKPYVYVYLDPRKPGSFPCSDDSKDWTFTFQPFYIGKGTGERYQLSTKMDLPAYKYCNKVLENKIKSILKEGKEPNIVILTCETEEEAFELESRLTNQFDIYPTGLLCNLKHGGKGGFTLTEETKAKLSELNAGEKNPCYGRKWTPERREKWMNTIQSKDMSRSPESMQKTWEGKNRQYLIRDTEGNEIIVTDLTKYCQENSLPLTAFRYALKNGNRVQSKKRVSKVEGYEIFYSDGK